MKILRILLFFMCTISTLQGQITQSDYQSLAATIPNEKTELLVNTSILLSGEFLYYQAYTLDLKSDAYSQISKLMYVELINADQEQIFRQKLNVQDNVASGEYFIPAALETGHYKLIAYTNWSKNNVKNDFDQVDIFIINPFTKRTQFASKDKDSLNIATLKLKDDNKKLLNDKLKNRYLDLSLNKTDFQTRSLVNLSITNTNLQETSDSYILNIRKIDGISLANQFSNSVSTNPNPTSYYLPDLRGEVISGTVMDTNTNKPLTDKTVYINFPDKTFILKTVRTNAFGKFYAIIDKNHTTEDAIIQVADVKDQAYSIILDTKIMSSYGDLKFSPLLLDENIKEWLEKRSIETQIENSYFEIKADSIVLFEKDHVFYGDNGTTYKLDDYTRFPTLRQTFIEIISDAFVTTKNDSIELHVLDLDNLDYNRNFSYLKPLVLMDGIVILNNEDIIDYSANRIESITVIRNIYVYGSQLYNGVISLISVDGKFSLPNTNENNTFNIIKPILKKNYYQPNYSDSNLRTIPDYRSQLLWKPNTKLKKGLNEFEFYTSDSKGTYEIRLEGYSENGIYSSNVIYFEVK